MYKKILLIVLFLVLIAINLIIWYTEKNQVRLPIANKMVHKIAPKKHPYTKAGEPPIALQEAFELQLEKHENDLKKHRYAILIDYDLPLFVERLWLMDRQSCEYIIHSKVSHAYNSGLIYATKFTNKPNTNTSCIGAFRTGGSYHGSFGYAMKLHGLEKGINDNAFKRAIVVHKEVALYSWGCFMTKPEINKKIIDLTKNGTFIWVHKSGYN